MADIKTPPVPPASEDNADVRKLAAELKGKKSQDYLASLQKLSEDPQYVQGVPPNTQDSLRQAINTAQQAYDQKVTRNEYMSIAQTLVDAVGKFGAAQAGLKSGVDMSNISTGPGVNYEARSDRAFKEYGAAIGNIDKEETRKQDQFRYEAADKKSRYDKAEDSLKTGLRTRLAEDEMAARAGNEKARNAREDSREDKREGKEDDRQAEADRVMKIKDLSAQEESLARRLKAGLLVQGNTALQEEIGEGKAADKLSAASSKALADADIRYEDVVATKPGMLWGTNPDPEKSKQQLDSKVAEIRNLLAGIQKRKQDLLNRTPAEASPSEAPAPGGVMATPPPAGKIKVRVKATGQAGSVDPGEFDPNLFEKI